MGIDFWGSRGAVVTYTGKSEAIVHVFDSWVCLLMSVQASLVQDSAGTEHYLTVTQAAALMSVHPSTIRRWIDRGMLPARRLKSKRIGIRHADLARLPSPHTRGQNRRFITDAEVTMIPPLTPDEKERGLRALAELERMSREILERRGNTPFSSSTEIIREMREERTRALMHDEWSVSMHLSR